MLKALFISLNLAGLALLPFLYVGNVSVEHQAPSEVEAGGSVEVTITLNKGTITGPARLKLDFSGASGLVAEEIENSGASFSFTGDNALYIWYSIQPAETITLKYRLKADANASGTKTVSGTFSYLDEEERKKMDIPSIIIEVTGGTVATTDPDPVVDPVVETTPEILENGSTTENKSTSPTDVSCSRTVEKSGEGFTVSIAVEKGAHHGFARIKEVVPSGFNAEALETQGAVFKFVDNNAKFLWTSLEAEKSVINVSYKLLPTTAAAGNYEISGEFSGEFLIVDDTPQSVAIPTSSFTLESGAAVAVNTNDGGNNNSENGNSSTSENGNNNGTTISGGNTDINYKVQVLAAHKTVSNSYIKRHYGYSGGIAIENHEGWVKYTTGSFNVYKEARDKRNTLGEYNFPGPFVTAYNKGERITVQEALMISKQEWVK